MFIVFFGTSLRKILVKDAERNEDGLSARDEGHEESGRDAKKELEHEVACSS